MDVEVDSATGDVLDENGDSDDKMRFAETTVYSLTECLEKSGETWINEKHICAGVIQRSSTKSEGVCIVSILCYCVDFIHIWYRLSKSMYSRPFSEGDIINMVTARSTR